MSGPQLPSRGALALRLTLLAALLTFLLPAFAQAASYREEVLADGPYAYYAFDGTSSATVADLSGNGRDLTGTGSLTMRQPGAVAGSKSALLTGGYFAAGSPFALSPQGDYTMEVWARPASTSTGGATAPILANAGIQSFCFSGAFIYQFDDRAAAMHANTCQSNATSQPSTTWPDTSTWRHIVLRRVSGVATLWIDGVQVGAPMTTVNPAITGVFAVGALAGWGGGYVGYVDDVSYYDKALSDERIVAHYNGRSLLAPAPAATIAPAITGQAKEFEQVAGTLGSWSGMPEGYTRQWQREGGSGYWSDIPGATAATYDVTADDLDRRLRLKVTADNGQTGVAYSDPTAPVAPSAPTNLTAASLSGSAPIGKIVKTTRGTWRGSPTITYAYEWLRCTTSALETCATIPGATGQAYTVQAGDDAQWLRARVTASNAAGSAPSTTAALRMGTDYAAAVQQSGASAFFRYDTNTGPIVNEMGTGNATLYGAPSRDGIGRTGLPGDRALSFTGVNGQFVDWTFNDANTTPGQANTVQAWLYINGQGTYQILGGHPANLLYYPAADCFGFNSEGECYGTSTAGLADGWHHITAVFFNGSVYGSRLFIDGAERTLSERVGGGSRHSSLTVGDPFKIIRAGGLRFYGYANEGAQFQFSGRIDDLAVYNRALTPAEVAEQYSMTITANTAPSNVGAPKVRSDTLLAGESVSVDQDAWLGKQAINKSYQWQKNPGSGWVDIPDAIEASYTPTVADVGATLRAVVTATNSVGSASANSNATSTVLPADPPLGVTSPQISGEAVQGHLLIAHGDTWTSSLPYQRTYRWQRSLNGVDWVDISGATSSQYQLGAVDGGARVRVIVTATSPIGPTSATSAATSLVSSGAPTNNTLPQVSGDARYGSVLSTTAGDWASEGGGTVTYSAIWQRGSGSSWTNIPGATSELYAITAADIGQRLRIKVTASNIFGSNEATSAPTDIAVDIAPLSVLAPSVGGTARSGQTLTADEGTWSSAATPSIAMLWQRDDGSGWQTIPAVGNQYALDDADIGARFRVAVTATTPLGQTTAYSAASAPVAARPASSAGVPVITGTFSQGNTLSVTGAAWSGSPFISVSYRWERLVGSTWRTIPGATSASFTPSDAYLDLPLRVIVTGSNAHLYGGAVATAQSEPIEPVVVADGGVQRIRVNDPYEIEDDTIYAPVRCVSGTTACEGTTRVVLPETGQVLDVQPFTLQPSRIKVLELNLSQSDLEAAQEQGYLLVEARTAQSLVTQRIVIE